MGKFGEALSVQPANLSASYTEKMLACCVATQSGCKLRSVRRTVDGGRGDVVISIRRL